MPVDEYKLEVRIPRDLATTLQDVAGEQERTIPQQVRIILKRWLADEGRPIKQSA